MIYTTWRFRTCNRLDVRSLHVQFVDPIRHDYREEDLMEMRYRIDQRCQVQHGADSRHLWSLEQMQFRNTMF